MLEIPNDPVHKEGLNMYLGTASINGINPPRKIDGVVGDKIIQQITVENTGTIPISNLIVKTEITDPETFVQISPECSIEGNLVTCVMPQFDANGITPRVEWQTTALRVGKVARETVAEAIAEGNDFCVKQLTNFFVEENTEPPVEPPIEPPEHGNDIEKIRAMVQSIRVTCDNIDIHLHYLEDEGQEGQKAIDQNERIQVILDE